MSMSASRCPSDASLRAVAAPMPVVEPVTTIRSDASVIPSSFVLRRRCRRRLDLPPSGGQDGNSADPLRGERYLGRGVVYRDHVLLTPGTHRAARVRGLLD